MKGEYDHKCHWPNCDKKVRPSKWGCSKHWWMLPKKLRDKIWSLYVPGQEITKTPSKEYIAAALEVRAWCLAEIARKTNEGFDTL